MTYEFSIPSFRVPLLNQLMRRKIVTRIRQERGCRELVAYYGREVPKARGKRRVSLEITLGPRQREPDADSPWKAMLDALVQTGLLRGDRNEHVELGGFICHRGAEPALLVILEDVQP